MADLQKIVDDLSKLTVLEAADLGKMLEEKWSSGSGSGSTVLFEDRERTRKEPLRRGEGLFEFYDSCASPGYDEFRSVVNGWLAQVPAGDRNELITRMRYGGDRELGASLAELSIHAFILGLGCRVSPHPEVPGSTKRPDYAATDETGALLGYVEVTTVNPSAAQEAEKNRENSVYNAIDAAKIPAGSALGYNLVRAGKSSPALGPLVANVERWARDNAEAAKTKEVSKTFTAGDWVVELDLYSGGSNPEPPTQAIGVAQMRGGIITPQKDLRDALYKKTRKYGALDKPYLIAVADGKDQLFNKDSINSALTEAVFGNEIVQFKGGTAHITHAKNGFWHGPNGPRSQHVSGVLLLPETGLWKLREEKWQPVLAVNPWAERPLPEALRTMRRFEAATGRWVFREGKSFADIVQLPDPWPLPEAR
jgi:Ribosomal protein L7/L12 dimerisation domain